MFLCGPIPTVLWIFINALIPDHKLFRFLPTHDQEEVSFAMPRFNKVMVRRLRKIERVLEGDVMRVAS